MLNSRT